MLSRCCVVQTAVQTEAVYTVNAIFVTRLEWFCWKNNISVRSFKSSCLESLRFTTKRSQRKTIFLIFGILHISKRITKPYQKADSAQFTEKFLHESRNLHFCEESPKNGCFVLFPPLQNQNLRKSINGRDKSISE